MKILTLQDKNEIIYGKAKNGICEYRRGQPE